MRGAASGRWRRRADVGAKIWVPSAPVSESEELGGFENFERDAVVGGDREGASEAKMWWGGRRLGGARWWVRW